MNFSILQGRNNNNNNNSSRAESAADESLLLGEFINAERAAIDVEVSSRKKLFERVAELLASPNGAPDVDAVLGALTKREKLGCTGLGRGVALPHGRIAGIARPLIAIARLKHAIDYDAADGVPVWLAVCLLAPVEADQMHLKLLAALAARFNAPGFCEQLKRARTADEMVARFKTDGLT